VVTPQHAMHYTIVKPFVDTNILLYAYDKEAGSRHAAAKAITKALWQQDGGILSTQVLQEFYVLSFWDALIMATAVQGGADMLLSEDLNAGQIIEGVLVVNPFEDSDNVLRQLCSNQPDI